MQELFNEYKQFIMESLNKDFSLDTYILNEKLTETTAINKLKKAIETQKYIGIYYNDGSPDDGFRLVEPFVLGKGFKRGEKISYKDSYYLRGYVIMDTNEDEYTNKKFKDTKLLGITIKKNKGKKSQSLSGKSPAWRLFKIDKITRIKIFNKKFAKLRPAYNPNDKMFNEIISNVSISKLTESHSFFD